MNFLKKKENVKTFVGGKNDDIPVPLPEEKVETPAEPASTCDCLVCRDYGWYADASGVCHNCPRCNPGSLREPAKKVHK